MKQVSSDITDLIRAFNRESEYPVVVCAATALSLNKISHYAYFGSLPYFLGCPEHPSILDKFLNANPDHTAEWRVIPFRANIFTEDKKDDFIFTFAGDPNLVVSTIERSILEHTYYVVTHGWPLRCCLLSSLP